MDTKNKINIHSFFKSRDKEYRGYRSEICRHIKRTPSWITQSLSRAKTWSWITLPVMKDICRAISVEEGREYSYRDFDWTTKK